jgi:predicted  nucleic acid-binding Zn-ribbon protein
LQALREKRDAEVDAVRAKYQKELDRLQERKSREQAELDTDKAQLTGRVAEEVVSGLGTLGKALGLFGRKSTRGLTSIATKRRMSATAQARVRESEDAIAQMDAQMAALAPEMQRAVQEAAARLDALAEQVESVEVSPRKSDIAIDLVALAWAPNWWVNYETARGHNQLGIVPAYPVAESH